MDYDKKIILAEKNILNLEKKVKHFENMNKLKEMEHYLKFYKHIERVHDSDEYVVKFKMCNESTSQKKIISKEDYADIAKKRKEYKRLCNFYYKNKIHHSEVGFEVSKNLKCSLAGTPFQMSRNSAPIQVFSETELTFYSMFMAGKENYLLFFDGCISELRKMKKGFKLSNKIQCR